MKAQALLIVALNVLQIVLVLITPENLGILLGKVSKEVSLLPKRMEKVTKEVKKGYNKGKK